MHDLLKDFQICLAKIHFLKNILIFSLALFQQPLLLLPGLSLFCFLRKHCLHQSPWANYSILQRKGINLSLKMTLDQQTYPLQRYLGKMQTSTTTIKQKDPYLFDLCSPRGFSSLVEIMPLYRLWTWRSEPFSQCFCLPLSISGVLVYRHPRSVHYSL